VTRRLVKAASRLASLIVLPGDLRRLRHERDVWEHLALRSTCTLHRYVEHHKGLPRAEVTSDVWCWMAPLEGCALCPGPTRGSSART
jgi:hypothetical protein